jgi:hypothetical protein
MKYAVQYEEQDKERDKIQFYKAMAVPTHSDPKYGLNKKSRSKN